MRKPAILTAFIALVSLAFGASGAPSDVLISVGEPIGQMPSTYGYAVIPLVLTNTSDRERVVRMECVSDIDWGYTPTISRLTRTIILPPSSTFEGTMLRPPARLPESPMRIWVDGQAKQDGVWLGDGKFAQQMPGWSGGSSSGDVYLVGRTVPTVVSAPLVDPYSWLFSSGSGSSTTSTYRGAVPAVDTVSADESWPTQWLAYSRFRLIVVTDDEWNDLSSGARAAILESVSAGNDLWIVTNDPPTRFTGSFTTTSDAVSDAADEMKSTDMRTVVVGLGHVSAISPGKEPPRALVFRQVRAAMNGWRATLSDDDGERTLPVAQSAKIPAGIMLGGLIVFALLIGPVNIFLMSRMNRRVLLFLTTPAIGLAFSIGVFIYGVAHDGTRTRALTRAVTILDTEAGVATTLAHSAYYAPFTPRNGLAVDDRTMVIPSMVNGAYGITDQPRLALDLTDGQRFTSGLVRPRVPTHVRFLHVEPRRERLVFTRDAAGGIHVQNGLGATMRAVFYVDAAHQMHTATDVPAGADAALHPIESDGGASFDDLSRMLMTADPCAVFYNTIDYPNRSVVPRNGFAAVLDASPFHDPGLENLRDHEASALVIGLAEVH